jgi:hypothetical protein
MIRFKLMNICIWNVFRVIIVEPVGSKPLT